jgi:hypothetical protein
MSKGILLQTSINPFRIETGPQNFIKEDHEEVITGNIIPKLHFPFGIN